MKKEFKTPLIEVCNINAGDSIMTSANILTTGGVSSSKTVYTFTAGDVSGEFRQWKKDWIKE